MKIKTNNVPRQCLCGPDLTDKERKEFDYLSEDEQANWRFVRYKGWVYDLHEFSCTTKQIMEDELKDWHGYRSDSFFSGVVVKYKDDDTVVMGTYFS